MPEGLTDFIRRGPPDKKIVVVCVSLCVSVANKNIYLSLSLFAF